MIALRTLNGLEVRRSSAEGSARLRLAPQQAALLVYLALSRPFAKRTRDQLTAMLWPELPAARARDALNQSVFRLRDLLGHDVVTREGDDIRIGSTQCDAVEFEAALDGDRLEAALDLYTGDLLAGVYLSQSGEFERWVDEERGRLRARAVTAALTLAKREERNGNPVGAVSRLRQAFGWSPYEEPVARDLVRMLVQLGDRASALRAYEGFAARLARDLSLPPPSDLEQYVRTVREGRGGQEVPIAPPAPDNPSLPTGSGARSGNSVPVLRASRSLRIALPLGLIIAGAAVFLLAKDRTPAPVGAVSSTQRVAVVPLANETHDTTLDILGTMAADWITDGLSRTGLAEVVSGATALSAVRGGRILVSGSYSRVSDSLRFRLRISDAATGALLTGVLEAAGPGGRPEPVLELLRQRTLGALAPLLDARFASWARVASRPPSFEAYQLYAAGLDRPLGVRSPSERVDYFLKAAARDSTFTAPLVWALTFSATNGQVARAESLVRVLEPRRAALAPWDGAMLDHALAQLRGNFPEAYSAMRRVVELAPNSEWELELAYWALWINRPREAIERLGRLDPEQRLRPYMPRRYWFILLAARHLVGDFEGVMADIGRMRRLQVESALASSHELAALAAMGRVAPVNRLTDALLASDSRSNGQAVLKAAMEFRTHGNSEAAEHLLQRLIGWYAALPLAGPSYFQEMARGEALFAAGRTAEARQLFERIVAEDTTRWTARGFLAQIAARQGDRAAAEREIRWQLGQAGKHAGGEAVIHAAAIAAELGDTSRAVHLARLAISQNFYYNHPSVHCQPRLEALWRIPAARALLQPAG